jgi:hypothetical protein
MGFISQLRPVEDFPILQIASAAKADGSSADSTQRKRNPREVFAGESSWEGNIGRRMCGDRGDCRGG